MNVKVLAISKLNVPPTSRNRKIECQSLGLSLMMRMKGKHLTKQKHTNTCLLSRKKSCLLVEERKKTIKSLTQDKEVLTSTVTNLKEGI
jgi:hypothetical protein